MDKRDGIVGSPLSLFVIGRYPEQSYERRFLMFAQDIEEEESIAVGLNTASLTPDIRL